VELRAELRRGEHLGAWRHHRARALLRRRLRGGEHVEDRHQRRLSCNLQDQTIEQVVGKMKTSHIALLDSMMDDLRHGVDGLPLSVLKPLEDQKDHCKKLDHEYFMKPQQYLKATKDALDATDACYANLADKESWNTTEVSDAVVA